MTSDRKRPQCHQCGSLMRGHKRQGRGKYICPDSSISSTGTEKDRAASEASITESLSTRSNLDSTPLPSPPVSPSPSPSPVPSSRLYTDIQASSREQLALEKSQLEVSRRATLGLVVSPSWKGVPSRQLSSTRNTKLASREIILRAALLSRRSSKSLSATVKPCGKLITTTWDPRTLNISAGSLPCLSTCHHLVRGALGRTLLTPVTIFLVFCVPVPRFSTFSAHAAETYPN
ncbi:hypothetical protein EDD15DRAFT_1213417 [Pisolithus albus]|nr:hypothetical protein EDD15DRAFT_1213417 [Pisolithus albus]